MKLTSVLPIRTARIASTIFENIPAAIHYQHPNPSTVQPQLIFSVKFSKAYSDFSVFFCFDFFFQ
jgi:hypothetical protein